MSKKNQGIDCLYKEFLGVLEKKYTDYDLIIEAYNVAYEYHDGQKRKSGEPYIIHPISTAIILANLEVDQATVIAGLLHDTLEDTDISEELIREKFGEQVLFLVKGVTKLATSSKKDRKINSYRNMLNCMAEDLRVLIIKLADRLHNLRTLNFQSREKQIAIAQETLDLYSPLALKIGLCTIKNELDDLSFMYLHYAKYNEITETINSIYEKKKDSINSIITNIKNSINSVDFEISYVQKHIFSIYRKTINNNCSCSDVYDFYYLSIVVNEIEDCYKILGEVHRIYKPKQSRFKDYIALPKDNMYQAIHTTIITEHGALVECQIKTKKMLAISKYGLLYFLKNSEYDEQKIYIQKNIEHILDLEKSISNNNVFIDTMRSELDIVNKKIYCYTPKQKLIMLPLGSCVIDFAYSIHSELGDTLAGALVNGSPVDPYFVLQNDDTVEILTDENNDITVCKEWLNHARSDHAMVQIKRALASISDEHEEKVKYIQITSFSKYVISNIVNFLIVHEYSFSFSSDMSKRCILLCYFDSPREVDMLTEYIKKQKDVAYKVFYE